MNNQSSKHIVVFSSIFDDWGGSEELWALAIPYLIAAGHRVSVVKDKIKRTHPSFVKLSNAGVQLVDLSSRVDRIKKLLYITSKPFENKIKLPVRTLNEQYADKIESLKPDYVIIGQGVNFDGLLMADEIRKKGIPYFVIAQKAVEFFWPHKIYRAAMRRALLAAKQSYFVSKHNLTLTQDQFGCVIPNATVVFNPIKLGDQLQPLPPTEPHFRLACVGRLFLLDKGQDILIRILSKEKWKNRPLLVNFIGHGVDDESLQEMARYLGVTNVEFSGFQGNMDQVWAQHHGLILPSRAEGMPLAMLEAMAMSRMVIVSTAGGNAEIVTDGVNGFIGECGEQSFEAAMERAWEQRAHWPAIAEKARETVLREVPAKPEQTFANLLLAAIAND